MRFRLLAVCAGALLLSCLPGVAAGDAGLFSADAGAAPALRRPAPSLLHGHALPQGDEVRSGASGGASPRLGGRSRVARIDLGRLSAARSEVARGLPHPIRLNLFADADFDAVFERTSPTASGYALTGRLADDPLGTVVLAVNGDVASGLVWGANGRYSIQVWGAGGALIRREARSISPVCAGPVRPPSGKSNVASSRSRRKANVQDSGSNSSVPPDDGDVIDVLVVYAPIARRLMGGHRAMRTLIDRDVAMTNEAYRVGGAAQQINLVGAVEVGHQGAPTWLQRSTGALDGTLLDHLRARDGQLDEVHALRDSYAADLVLMHIGHTPNVSAGPRGGIAFAPEFVPSEDSADLGFSISGSLAFAHELGHNMGLRHERSNDPSNLPFPYSHGYLFEHLARDWGTIMATVSDRLPRFSNPRQKWRRSDGFSFPLGVPGDEPSSSADGPADAVRSLNGTRRAVANFRASVGRCRYSLAPESPVLPAEGGEFRVRVETAPGCEWSAISDGGFLTIPEGSGGVGGGEVVYRAPANEGWEREAAILVAAEVYMVRQQGVRTATPLSERTPVVSEAISKAVGKPLAEITASDLASVGILVFNLYHESDLPKPGDFDGLSLLSTLRITWNIEPVGHVVLEPGVFDGLSNLRHLVLDRFSAFKPGIFDGLHQLIDLHLIETKALAVTADLFDGLSNVLKLGLQGSGVASLAPNAFSELSNLKTLYLGPNPIEDLVPGVFNGLHNLSFLQLENLQLMSLPPGVFDGLAKLEYLFLRDNRLAALSPGAFDGLAELGRLDLSGNRLAALPPGVFDGLPELGSLHLSDNQLAMLPGGFFAGTQLYHLDLSGNRLATLPGGLFAGTRLYELNLSGNQLTALSSSLFAGVRAVNRLNLASNLLRTLPAGLFDGVDFDDHMDFLALEGNPGAPFAFTVEVVRPPAAGSASGAPAEVVPKVAEGAPFDVRVRLSASDGSLSSDEVRIAKGAARGEATMVTPSGGAPVVVTIADVANDAGRVVPLEESCGQQPIYSLCYSGFRLVAGPPLVLYGLADQTLAAENGAISFDLATAFPNFPEGTAYMVELSDPAAAEATVREGLLIVSATSGGETEVAVTAMAPDGRREARRFTVTVEQPVGSLWGGWRSALLRPPPAAGGDGS